MKIEKFKNVLVYLKAILEEMEKIENNKISKTRKVLKELKMKKIDELEEKTKFCSNKKQVFGKTKQYQRRIEINKNNKKKDIIDRQIRRRNKGDRKVKMINHGIV